jgi:hypothetical protein
MRLIKGYINRCVFQYYLKWYLRMVLMLVWYYSLCNFFYGSFIEVEIDNVLVFAEEEEEFVPREVIFEQLLDERRRQRFWNYLGDERRTIFDRYDPAYGRDAFHLVERWSNLAEGRVVEEEEDIIITYKIEELFVNTVWQPGYTPENEDPLEWVDPYTKTVGEMLKPWLDPLKDSIAPYITTRTVLIIGVIGFVVGTTYIGYLEEQGHFDWLDAAQANVDRELKIRFDIAYDWIKESIMRSNGGSRGGGLPPPPPSR